MILTAIPELYPWASVGYFKMLLSSGLHVLCFRPVHSHKKLISEKVSKLCCCMGWKSPLIIGTFGARRCNELIFCTDLHEAVLYRIEEVLAAANCAGPWNRSLSGGALKSKQQLSGNLFILFCKLFILKLWLRSFEETVHVKFESFLTSAVSYDGASCGKTTSKSVCNRHL